MHTLSLESRVAFDPHTITLLTSRCTNVHFLSLPIRRAWNRPGEDTAILRALGRIPHLTHLDLTLDASDRTLLSSPETKLATSDPSFDAFDNQPGAPESRISSLRYLSIKAEGGRYFGISTISGGIDEVVREVGKEWVVQRSGEGEGIEVRCVGEINEYFEPGDELASDIGHVFRSIWPGEGDWWDEWHAFPLV